MICSFEYVFEISGVHPVKFVSWFVNLDADGGIDNEGACCCDGCACVFFADCTKDFLNGVDATLFVAGVFTI